MSGRCGRKTWIALLSMRCRALAPTKSTITDLWTHRKEIGSLSRGNPVCLTESRLRSRGNEWSYWDSRGPRSWRLISRKIDRQRGVSNFLEFETGTWIIVLCRWELRFGSPLERAVSIDDGRDWLRPSRWHLEPLLFDWQVEVDFDKTECRWQPLDRRRPHG